MRNFSKKCTWLPSPVCRFKDSKGHSFGGTISTSEMSSKTVRSFLSNYSIGSRKISTLIKIGLSTFLRKKMELSACRKKLILHGNAICLATTRLLSILWLESFARQSHVKIACMSPIDLKLFWRYHCPSVIRIKRRVKICSKWRCLWCSQISVKKMRVQ